MLKKLVKKIGKLVKKVVKGVVKFVKNIVQKEVFVYIATAVLAYFGYVLLPESKILENVYNAGKVIYEATKKSNQKSEELEDMRFGEGAAAGGIIMTFQSSSPQKSEKQLCIEENLPSFMNLSLYLPEHENMPNMPGEAKYTSIFEPLSPKTVFVHAAGNDEGLFKELTKLSAAEFKQLPPAEQKRFAYMKYRRSGAQILSQKRDFITVGALSSYGERAGYSNQLKEVDIMAPAGGWSEGILAHDAFLIQVESGGTSLAAPLVTGSLGAFEWLSGYHPTAQEAKTLLKKTAIMTRHSYEAPQFNGAGMLNAYKLGMVGKKLKEICGTDESCFQQKINDDNIYEFPEDTGLLSEMAQVFPECAGRACAEKPSSCLDQKAVFDRLRKAAFLDPENEQLWRDVACVYQTAGFDRNAFGMMNIAESSYGPDGYPDSSKCSFDSDCVFMPICGLNGFSGFQAGNIFENDIFKFKTCSSKELCEIQEAGLKKNSTKFQLVCENSRCVSNSIGSTGVSHSSGGIR